MSIKRFDGFENVKGYGEAGEMLPRGGYVIKIIDAKVENKGYGDAVKLAFDIHEGEYKDYYLTRYNNNQREDKKWPGIFYINLPKDDGTEKDNWTKRRFKTFIDALEESNEGFHFDWDEKKFANKLLGMVFNYRQYEFNGNVGMTPNPARTCSVKAIRDGRYKVPEDKMLKHQPSSVPPGFTEIKGDDTELPF